MHRAVTATLIVGLLAACGHRAVDRAGFVEHADAICRDVAERFGRLSVTEDGPAVFYREARRINAEGAALLRGILAPEHLRDDIRVLAERIDAAARLYASAARLAVDGRSTTDVERSIGRIGADFARRARALGLTRCGVAPSPTPRPSR